MAGNNIFITQAAIRYNGKIYTLPRPKRHHDIIHHMAGLGFGPECMHDQGFITNHGIFVDRIEAKKIAREANQFVSTYLYGYEKLYSEDIW